VEFPSTFKPEEISLKVLDCATQLENSKNPYGAVREGYAQLTVRGRLLPGILYIEKTPNGDVKYEATASLFAVNDQGNMMQVSVTYDAWDSGEEEDNKRGVVLLELSDTVRGRTWMSSGLVLRWIHNQTFSRLGVFDFKTQLEEPRQGETREAYQARICQHYNWFHYCIPRVITIV